MTFSIKSLMYKTTISYIYITLCYQS